MRLVKKRVRTGFEIVFRRAGLLVPVFICCALFFFPSPLAFAGDADQDPAGDFLRLKLGLETKAGDLAGRPEELACLGLETTAMAWALAALNLAGDEASGRLWRNRIEKLEGSGADDDPERRRLAALELYYDALHEVALNLARQTASEPFEVELRTIRTEALAKLGAVDDNSGAAWARKAVISEAAALTASALARALGGAPLSRPTAEIMARLRKRTEALDRRTDLHHRARMRLIYLAHLRELTSLTFLMGLSAGPPVSGQMASIHAELNRRGSAINSETGSEGLIWTAQAQASIPLAYWLATVPLKSPDSPAGP